MWVDEKQAKLYLASSLYQSDHRRNTLSTTEPMSPRTTETPTRAAQVMTAIARWLAAVICIVYGFAKLNGSQFTVLDSELAKPLGEVSGFWLTWHYFGYSAPYGTLLALLQIGAALLLVWPRTSLIGALLLLPIFANIVLVDIFFRIQLGATVVALVVLVCVSLVIAPHAERLLKAVVLDSPSRYKPVRLAAIALIVIGAWGLTWWAANINNRLPTPIDGTWAPIAQAGNDASNRQWERVFFERNRAHMVVFRAPNGRDETHHFEIDANGMIRIWETWLRKDSLIMQGTLNRDGHLELETPRGRIVLRREKPPRSTDSFLKTIGLA